MNRSNTGLSQRRLFSSYFTSIISNMLLLFMLGLLGFILLNTRKLSDYVMENIGFTVILTETAREPDIIRLKKHIEGQVYTKTTLYITKDEAALRLQDDLGEDFIGFFGYNPLVALLEVQLKAAWTNADSIAKIDRELRRFTQISDVYYEKNLIDQLNRNVHKISIILLGFSGLMVLIAIALINNTIRLSIHSRRFLIRTMQLVGATSSFIRRPFIWKGMLHGVYASLAACSLLTLLLFYLSREIVEISEIIDVEVLAQLYPMVILFGVFFYMISTFLAVNRYLRMSTDDLYG